MFPRHASARFGTLRVLHGGFALLWLAATGLFPCAGPVPAQEIPPPVYLASGPAGHPRYANETFGPTLISAEEARGYGHPENALAVARRVLGQQRQQLGSDHPLVGITLEYIASLQEMQNQFDAALKTRQEIVDFQQRVHGADHWQVTDARLALAHTRRLAQEGQRRSQLRTAEELDRQARWLGELDRYPQAIPKARQAVQVRKEILGEDDPFYLASLLQLGRLYRGAGQTDQAQPLLSQVLQLSEQRMGPEHPQVARAHEALGDLSLDREDLKGAEEHYQQALTIYRKCEGEAHEDYQGALARLGEVHEMQAQFEAARKNYEEILAIHQKLREQPQATAPKQSREAPHPYRSWREAEARRALDRVDRLARLGEGERKELIQARRQQDQGRTLFHQERFAEGIPLARQAVAARTRILGETAPESSASLTTLGWLLEEAGQLVESRSCFERASSRLKRTPESEAARVEEWARAADLSRMARLTPEEGQKFGEAIKLEGKAVSLSFQRPQEAVPPLQAALAIYRKVCGEDSPEVVRCLEQLGRLRRKNGDEAQAKEYEEQAAAIRRNWASRIPGDWKPKDWASLSWSVEDPETADLLEGMGWVLHLQGDDQAAVSYLGGANNYYWELYYTEGVHPFQRWAWRFAGALSHLQAVRPDSTAPGLEAYRGAVLTGPRYQDLFGPDHPGRALLLSTSGAVKTARQQFGDALADLEQALAFQRVAPGPDSLETATTLNRLARLSYREGEYELSRAPLDQALAVRVQALGKDHPAVAESRNDLGLLLLARGDREGARKELQEALAIDRKALGNNHPETARTLESLASLSQATGDGPGALAAAREALAIRPKAPRGDARPETAACLMQLGDLLYAGGDYRAAEPCYREALAVCDRIRASNWEENSWDRASSLYKLGLLYFTLGDPQKAEPLVSESVTLTAKNRRGSAAFLSDRQQLMISDRLRERLDCYLSLAQELRLPGDQVYLPVLRWKGAAFSERVRPDKLQETPDLFPDIVRLRSELLDVTGQIASRALTSPAPGQEVEWRRQIEELARRKEMLEVTLSRLLREGDNRAEVKLPPERGQLDAYLKGTFQFAFATRAALVDFLEYSRLTPPTGQGKVQRQRRLLAFVIRPDQPAFYQDLGPMGPIESAIRRWRLRFAAPGLRNDDTESGADLRHLLWEPIASHLSGYDTVLISPDGPLGELPFAALPGEKPGTYLIEEKTFGIAPVPQMLARAGNFSSMLTPAGGGEATLLLVGDVDFGAPGEGPPPGGETRVRPKVTWPALSGTGREIEAIQKTFQRHFLGSSVRALRGKAATKEALVRLAPGYRFIHLATHGFVASPEMQEALAANLSRGGAAPGEALPAREGVSAFYPQLLSGVVLAGANHPPHPEKDNAILTAFEVDEMSLRKVELVVLSACETGLGKERAGEGVLGLQRAFLSAGAGSTVVGLWQVPDEATRLLMEHFYDNLRAGNMVRKTTSKLEAMRQAQLWMLREGRQQQEMQRGFRALPEEEQPTQAAGLPPYYWAAFVLSGR